MKIKAKPKRKLFRYQPPQFVSKRIKLFTKSHWDELLGSPLLATKLTVP